MPAVSESSSASPVEDLFLGYMAGQVFCQNCQTLSISGAHSFSILPLTIPDTPDKQKALTLMDCFTTTFAEETLSGDNAYNCNKCHRLTDARKSTLFTRFPFYLCFQLKRGIDKNLPKNDALVHYPETLNLDGLETVEDNQPGDANRPPAIYDLYAVVCHHGYTPEAGHYTTYALNPLDHQWRHFNDEVVARVGNSPPVSREAYLLFYRRRRVHTDQLLREAVQNRAHLQAQALMDSLFFPQSDYIRRDENRIINTSPSWSSRKCFIGGVMKSV